MTGGKLFIWSALLIPILSLLLPGCGPSRGGGSSTVYTVSGRVTVEGTDKGLEGVTIVFSEGFSPTTTDENGYWSKSGLSGSVTVTPLKKDWIFTPPWRKVTGPANNVNFTASPVAEAPAAPSNLTVTAASNTSITLTWQDNSDNESGFYIYRREVAGTYPSTPIGNVSSDVTTFSDTGVEVGKTYYYCVRAYNAGGLSAPTNEVSALALNQNPPASPSGLTIEKIMEEDGGSLAVYLRWQDASNNEQKFILERRKEAETNFSVLAEIDTPNIAGTGGHVYYTDWVSPEDGTCYYRVKAGNVYGSSGYSDEISTIGSIEIIIQ